MIEWLDWFPLLTGRAAARNSREKGLTSSTCARIRSFIVRSAPQRDGSVEAHGAAAYW
jgi:hypothetical protein